MKKLLEFIIKNIVQHPKAVKIEQQTKEGNLLILDLKVHKQDVGQVIGKQGKIIKAIRNILKIKAIKENTKFSLNLQEDWQKDFPSPVSHQEQTLTDKT